MKKIILSLLLAGMVLAACSSSATSTPIPTPASDITEVPIISDDFAVVAQGSLVPWQYANLSFDNIGKVAEVLVHKGDTVQADAVIARLESGEILKAPFAGVIADLKVKVGELASHRQPAVILADFSKWTIETDNLTEIEVVKVYEGQKVSIILDALPDVTLHGVVTTISPVFEEKRGDVTYTVTIQLSDSAPKMRWGMTAVLTFEK